VFAVVSRRTVIWIRRPASTDVFVVEIAHSFTVTAPIVIDVYNNNDIIINDRRRSPLKIHPSTYLHRHAKTLNLMTGNCGSKQIGSDRIKSNHISSSEKRES
jgi:hypothetical protein